MFKKIIIHGCDGQGDGDSPYLTRWYLFKCPWGQLCLHYFHRSDNADALHSHPWSFLTLILWRGYTEYYVNYKEPCHYLRPVKKRRIYPGMIFYRPREWTHRVELLENKPAVTLVWMGIKESRWGFYTPTETEEIYEDFEDYFERLGC